MWHGFMAHEAPYACWEMIKTFSGNAYGHVMWDSVCSIHAMPGSPLLMAALAADAIAAQKEAEAVRAKDYCNADVIAAMKQAWMRAGNGQSRTEAGFSVGHETGGTQIVQSENPNTVNSTKVSVTPGVTTSVFHTHPNGTDPKPSSGDRAAADATGLPFYTITSRGLFEYDPRTKQTKEVRKNTDWMKPCS